MFRSAAAAKSRCAAWLPVCAITRTSVRCASSSRVNFVRSRFAISASKPRSASGEPNGFVKITSREREVRPAAVALVRVLYERAAVDEVDLDGAPNLLPSLRLDLPIEHARDLAHQRLDRCAAHELVVELADPRLAA